MDLPVKSFEQQTQKKHCRKDKNKGSKTIQSAFFPPCRTFISFNRELMLSNSKVGIIVPQLIHGSKEETIAGISAISLFFNRVWRLKILYSVGVRTFRFDKPPLPLVLTK